MASTSLKRDFDSEENQGPPQKLLKSDHETWISYQEKLEDCVLRKCFCGLNLSEILRHLGLVLSLNQITVGDDENQRCLLAVNLMTSIGTMFHDNLSLGMVCSTLQTLVNHLLQDTSYLQGLLEFTKVSDSYLKYSASQAISSLLPLSFCGQDVALSASQEFIQNVISQLKFTRCSSNSGAILSSRTSNLSSNLGQFSAEVPDLHLDDLAGVAALPGLEPSSGQSPVLQNKNFDLTDSELESQSWLIRILHDFISHGSKQKDDPSASVRNLNESCDVLELEDEMLCQEIQVKCCLIKQLEPVWEQLTRSLADVAAKLSTSTSPTSSTLSHNVITPANSTDALVLNLIASSNSTQHSDHFSENRTALSSDKKSERTGEGRQVGRLVYSVEVFKLWRALISVRANLNFVESRNFAANLSLPVHQLQKETPSLIWREVMDTVSECLCYGSTLGLQSIPPEEPCQLAHTLIRLIRFDGFLSRVPHNRSVGFGGKSDGSDELTGNGDEVEEEDGEDYDKGLVQKIILIVLKSVALTTRESRVDSSSGESDSSLSSHESASSCTSDLVIIERNMHGVYKQVDRWIKNILPILPDTSLQDNILNFLQEQDDVLIEGLLCLLDTHIALQHPNRDTTQVLPDNCPTAGFIKFLSIVGDDSSVLLDFLVSNETCFLLYLLRYLKYIIKDWGKFVSSCGSCYSSTVQVILNLKSSIQRLLTKDLFPYNIAPVYKLLEKFENLVDQNK